MSNEVQIPLSDRSFRSLIQKFAEEIAELESAVRAEPTTTELYQQLTEAVVQSRGLREELLQVFAMYEDAQRDDCRHFTTEEASALKYFGFAVPQNGRPPPAEVRDPGYIRLPSQRIASQDRESSTQNETETDVTDTVLDLRAAQRQEHPEHVSSPGPIGRHHPSGEHHLSPYSFVASPSPGAAPVSGDRLMERYVLSDKGKLENELRQQIRESLEREWQQEKTSMRHDHEGHVLQLQQQVVDLRTSIVESREKASALVVETEALYGARLSHAEERCHRQAEELSALRVDFDKQRLQMATMEVDLQRKDSDLHKLVDDNDYVRRELHAKKLSLGASIEQLTALLESIANSERNELVDACSELRASLEAQQAMWQHAMQAPLPRPSSTSQQSLVAAMEALHAVEAQSNAPPTFSLENCNDTDDIDVAVIRTLNELAFPFAVAIRRLGRGGDYFIDRRVQVRAVDGQPMVRPHAAFGRQAASYEHLGQYLMALYAPLLDFDDELGEPLVAASSGHGVSARVAALQEEHQELLRSLTEKQTLLLENNRRVAAELSPSPNAARDNHGWRRPPSPSPLPHNDLRVRLAHDVNESLKRGQQELLQQKVGVSGAAPKKAAAAAPRPHDLSQLTSQELEQLKRAALAQQLREMKKLQGRK